MVEAEKGWQVKYHSKPIQHNSLNEAKDAIDAAVRKTAKQKETYKLRYELWGNLARIYDENDKLASYRFYSYTPYRGVKIPDGAIDYGNLGFFDDWRDMPSKGGGE